MSAGELQRIHVEEEERLDGSISWNCLDQSENYIFKLSPSLNRSDLTSCRNNAPIAMITPSISQPLGKRADALTCSQSAVAVPTFHTSSRCLCMSRARTTRSQRCRISACVGRRYRILETATAKDKVGHAGNYGSTTTDDPCCSPLHHNICTS